MRVSLLLFLAVAAGAQVLHVQDLTTSQIRALDRATTAVILPGGILEEHGPYLPAFTDGYLSQRMAADLARSIAARPGWKALVFPQIPLGAEPYNFLGGQASFPGSYPVRASTLRAIFMDLAGTLGEQGFRWIFVVHVHGAGLHNRALDQASDYFRDVYHGRMAHLWGMVPVIGAWGKAMEPLPGGRQEGRWCVASWRPGRNQPDALPASGSGLCGLQTRSRSHRSHARREHEGGP